MIKYIKLSVLLISMWCMVSCGGRSPDSHFYLLNPLPPSYATGSTVLSPATTVAIGPIHYPEYLNTPQLVIRTGDNKIRYAEFDRWAEPLSDNATNVLTENLKTQLPDVNFIDFPWRGNINVNYQVKIDILRFEADSNHVITFHVLWSIVELKDKKEHILLKKAQRYTYSFETRASYAKVIVELNNLLNTWSLQLAKDLAENIQTNFTTSK